MCLSAILSAVIMKRVTAMEKECYYPSLTVGDTYEDSDYISHVYDEAPPLSVAPAVVSDTHDESTPVVLNSSPQLAPP